MNTLGGVYAIVNSNWKLRLEFLTFFIVYHSNRADNARVQEYKASVRDSQDSRRKKKLPSLINSDTKMGSWSQLVS